MTGLGLDLPSTWAAVAAGRCGIGPSNVLESTPSPDKGVGQAPDLPTDFLPGRPRESRYLRWAIDGALRGGGVDLGEGGPYPPDRCGIVIGTTLHGMRAAGTFLRTDDPEPLRDFLAASTLRSAAGDLPVTGFSSTTCAACASGLAAVALGMTLLRSGQLDLVIAGGYDPISEYAYGGFNGLRLIAESPQRPFARDREGMKLAEGYGIVVLERAEDARRRNAPVFADLLACGAASDAHHLSQPHPEGNGAARAIEDALRQAGLTPGDVGMVAAHATATPDNDGAEFAALARVFGDRLRDIPVTAFKSHLGHTLGAAGVVEMILAAMAVREQTIPPCANVRPEDAEFDGLQLITETARSVPLNHALVTSLGFGGSNACAIVARPPSDMPGAVQPPPASNVAQSPPAVPVVLRAQSGTAVPHDAVITGVGAAMPGAVGNEPFAELFHAERQREMLRENTGSIEEEWILPLLHARRVRRLSDYVKLSLATATLACRDAGLESIADHPGRCGAILGTTHGSAAFSEEYYRRIVEEGIDAANPLLFAEGVPNAGSAHLSMALPLKGPCQTLIGSRTAGLEALMLAAMRIRNGEWDRAIVGAAEEFAPLVNRAYAHCGLQVDRGGGEPFHEKQAAGHGFVTGAGSVTLVIESREAAEQRGATIRGIIDGTAQAVWSDRPPSDVTLHIGRMLERIDLPPAIVTSANATILDRLEAGGIAHALRREERNRDGVAVSSTYGHIAECFSATPLAAVAAVLLSGHLPRLHGPGPGGEHPLRPATGEERPESFAVLCSDYNGTTTATRIGLPENKP